MATNIRPIRTEDHYQAALSRIDALMDAEPDSDEADELEVLTTLLELFEEEHFPINLPDPITAIKFRMEQEGLNQSDLVPILGSRAKVSEVLSGKRGLTLRMIRALNKHLGIPAEALIQERGGALPQDVDGIEWERFPLSDMARRGWIENTKELKDRAEEVMRDLIERAGGTGSLPQALYRKTAMNGRRNASTNPYALQAWCLQVLADARNTNVAATYTKETITEEFLRELAKLSTFNAGPKLAREYLNQHGAVLVIKRHLPRTYLDGAAMRTIEGTPVVGMTLRHDRIDNFWFCLLHELAHIKLHISSNEGKLFVDDLSLRERDHRDDDAQEREADELAQDALLPPALWENHPVRTHPTKSNAVSLAREAGVHPAIVAGRVRYEHQNYRLLSQFVGNKGVRRHFSEEAM